MLDETKTYTCDQCGATVQTQTRDGRDVVPPPTDPATLEPWVIVGAMWSVFDRTYIATHFCSMACLHAWTAPDAPRHPRPRPPVLTRELGTLSRKDL